MTTTTLTQHDHDRLKAQSASWPIAWDHGRWIEREDTMVFLVNEKPRAFLPKAEFLPFVNATVAKTESSKQARHR